MQSFAPQTFTKNERLKSRKEILRLMSRGSHAEYFPLTAKYAFGLHGEGVLSTQDAAVNTIMVVVPKRLFKLAVDRNLLKRRMREAYRRNKQILPPCGASLSFTYAVKEKFPYSKIEKAVKAVLSDINNKVPKNDIPEDS